MYSDEDGKREKKYLVVKMRKSVHKVGEPARLNIFSFGCTDGSLSRGWVSILLLLHQIPICSRRPVSVIHRIKEITKRADIDISL